MMDPRSENKSPLSSGWILVSGLLLLCVSGTWFTAHNYQQRVFSSARGVVLENQWPESRISVPLSESEARAIHPGQVANITMGSDTHLMKGAVVSVTPGKGDGQTADGATVLVRLIGEPMEQASAAASGASGAANSPKPHHYLPVGATCSVTIDTTIPPAAIAPEQPISQ